ncbi:hypothetical protein F2Q68_00025475 [Brassica cretica]|uniref:Uncharacterized protein n=2 Tax=Brassica cretica TaxID=69181 RepID=A0A8S9IHU4_BRACR|nr:hypothetical protein F2Q68_00025475 [Brassica cretica]KAF3582400.1 hypothetical protein DY000_02031341 [Brassica cretica]
MVSSRHGRQGDRETLMYVAEDSIEVNFGDYVMRRQHSKGGCSGGWRRTIRVSGRGLV